MNMRKLLERSTSTSYGWRYKQDGQVEELPMKIADRYLNRMGNLFDVKGVRRGDCIVFTGGRFGEHSVRADDPLERILIHWEGYCAANGLDFRVGTKVGFTDQIRRYTTVTIAPNVQAKTVQLGTFRYKHGGMSKPRRKAKDNLTIVSQVEPRLRVVSRVP